MYISVIKLSAYFIECAVSRYKLLKIEMPFVGEKCTYFIIKIFFIKEKLKKFFFVQLYKKEHRVIL